MTYGISPAQLQAMIPDWSSAGPAYADLAAAVQALIMDGRLPLGCHIPAERGMARQLGIGRNTVAAAYRQLRDRGYVQSTRGAGTFVTLPRQAQPGGRPTSWIPPHAEGDVIDFTIASPPLPPEMIRQTMESARGDLDRFCGSHGYDNVGIDELRETIAALYTGRGLPTSPGEILVTAGAHQAWLLLQRLLTRRGDHVLLDSPTYPGVIDAVRALGRETHFVGLEPTGWNVNLLESVIRRSRPGLAYAMADFHNPTGLVMPDEVRVRLVRSAERANTHVVFDETLSDLALDPTAVRRPTLPGGPSPRAILIGSLSKLCWAGLRIGWIRTTPAMVSRLAEHRALTDSGNSVPSQLMAVHLLRSWPDLVARQRAALAERYDSLSEALRTTLPQWSFTEPEGGLSLWVDLGARIGSRLQRAATDHGISVLPGSRFGADGTLDDHVRLPLVHDRETANEGVKRLAAALRQAEESTR